MILNINPDTFDILGQGLRNGDLVAVCNVVEHLRQQRGEHIQFYLKPGTLSQRDYVRQFHQWLLANTDYFSLTPGKTDLPWRRVMLWDFRDIAGDLVSIPNTQPRQQKLVVFPLYDAEYNTYRNWTPELLTKILLFCNVEYPDHEKILCAREDMRNYLDPCGFTCSTDFVENLAHIMTAAVFVGGDTGTSHFASALNPGPRELIYYYSGRGMLHSLPFYSLEGRGKIYKFWHNFEGTTWQ